ncbi:MAG TPA: DNA polymerase/3'-5' exonuclease PolX [Anaerolineaceae bacterium]
MPEKTNIQKLLTEAGMILTNQELADTFDRIANLLEIKGEIIYKTLAYRKAAESLRAFPEEASILYAQNNLTDIPGVGKAIAEKISELLTSGQLGFLLRLEEEVPPSLTDLLQVPDVGPRKVALFWKQAGVTTLPELEAAARSGKLRSLPGMGEKSEARVIDGIEALKRRPKRRLLGNVRPVALDLLEWLRSLPGVEQAETAGSLRRWKSTIGDLDLVAASRSPADVMAAFITLPQVLRVVAHGENKTSVELKDGLNIQLWVQPPERFGTLLQFVSGSKDHNVRLRELAQKKKLSLSEQAITDSEGLERRYSAEEEVYAALGLPWIPPELREDRGEIQAALAGRLPQLVEVRHIRADLHTHTTWSDGVASVQQMAEAAIQRGRKILAITDHSGGLAIAQGLTVERLRQQRLEINQVQQRLGDAILLLQGSEVEIRADGSLDYPDEVLAGLDIVIASIHTSLRQERAVITARLLNAMRNPHVDVIGHPSGRLMPNREGADLDWEQVLATAKETGVALEIDAHPSRMDLDEVYARRASEMGILLTIDTDAHATDQLDLMEYGVSVARRAWVGPESILNTWETEKMLSFLKNHKAR